MCGGEYEAEGATDGAADHGADDGAADSGICIIGISASPGTRQRWRQAERAQLCVRRTNGGESRAAAPKEERER